jgi:hypothetical protein
MTVLAMVFTLLVVQMVFVASTMGLLLMVAMLLATLVLALLLARAATLPKQAFSKIQRTCQQTFMTLVLPLVHPMLYMRHIMTRRLVDMNKLPQILWRMSMRLLRYTVRMSLMPVKLTVRLTLLPVKLTVHVTMFPVRVSMRMWSRLRVKMQQVYEARLIRGMNVLRLKMVG